MPAVIGSIVQYRMRQADVDSVHYILAGHPYPQGVVRFPDVGQYLAAIVLRVNAEDETVDLKVLLDGRDTVWVTDVPAGDGDGQWIDIPAGAPPTP
jgi:hypothetical protein